MSALAPLLLFALFACCVVLVLLFGADIYRGLAQRDRENYQQRTAVQYLTTRVRQSDCADMVFIGDFDKAVPDASGDTVFIREVLGDRTYYTRIYCHDGYLCELFGEATQAFTRKDGERILEAGQLRILREGSMLRFEMVFADAQAVTFTVTRRTGKDSL